MKINNLLKRIQHSYREKSIQFMLSLSFTTIAVAGMIFVGFMLYSGFVASASQVIIEDNERLIEQVGLNLDSYVRNMMRISESMYYTVIKNTDLADANMDKEMNLLYEANKGTLIGISCFSSDGELRAAAPVSQMLTDVNVTGQDWFVKANQKIENLHFSTPHVQNLFDESNYRYYWVISLSRVVELTEAGSTSRGILLVDMNFSGIEQLFTKVNTSEGSYVYLMDSNGEIIYHPRQKLIYSNLMKDNNVATAGYEDGIHTEEYGGEQRSVIVKTVGYTGWKIVSVTPVSQFSLNLGEMRFFLAIIMVFTLILITFLNLMLSAQIANPIKKLERSVRNLEKGEMKTEGEIYIGGSQEVQHLGRTIRSMVNQMRTLMNNVVREQEKKRKSELDALQSQINPHFLYNTLDSIVWMVECERYKEAISMVTALANLFRVSLSEGNTVIMIDKELQHAKNYVNIQKVRYKNRFEVVFEVDEEVLCYSTVKLILQPLIENAIYHGMESMDGDGLITVRCYRKGGEVFLEVADNGLGIPEQIVATLLTKGRKQIKKGSGIGLRNVHQRIKLYFGEIYGLVIESEPDVGTTVRIHLPAVPFDNNEARDGGADEKK